MRWVTNDEAATRILFTTRDGVQVHAITVPAAEVRAAQAERVRMFDRSGLWPVILPTESAFDGFDEVARFVENGVGTWAPPLVDILATAGAADPETLFAFLRLQTTPLEDADEPGAWDSFDESEPTGRVAPVPERLLPKVRDAVIALFPVSASEDIPAVLGWGDWNACPPAHRHVTVLAYWRQRYGAELWAMSNDTLELSVRNPPTTFTAAVELARQQYAYASDIIDQGEHESVGALARALVDSEHWHFWWD